MRDPEVQQTIKILLLTESSDGAGRIPRLLAREKGLPYDLQIAKSITQGFEALENISFDVVLLDLSLLNGRPHSDMDAVLAKAGHGAVIALSGEADAAFLADLGRRGVQDHWQTNQLDTRKMWSAVIFATERKRKERALPAQSDLPVDIHGKAETEEALRQSEERSHSILNAIPDGYFEVDLRGNMKMFNDAMCNFFGYSREEMAGLNHRVFTDESNAKKITGAFNKVYRTKQPDIVEYVAFRKNGARRHVECRVSLIKDRDDQILGFRGIGRDVTERKEAEEALRLSEERYRTILENTEYGYFEMDLKGNFTFFNDALCKMTGYPRGEVMGMNIRQHMDAETAGQVFEIYKEIYRTGKPNRDIRYERVRKDGTPIYVESAAYLMTDKEGRPVGFRGIARDATEQKKAEMELEQAKEAAEEAAQSKSKFLANMSHEIRTPINGILGMYNLLLDTPLNDEQVDYVETGKRCADGLLNIINDILDFSKIEAGKMDFEVLDFDLRNTMKEVVELPARQAHQKGVEFAYQIHPEIPSLLRSDPGRLRQILTNLSTNAVKFTEKGEVVIRVTPEEQTETHVKIRFAVQDTGIGISPADQKRLFQSFHQADASTTRKYGGTGLGLAISTKLVELMGGEIGLESQPGVGSTFWFTARFEKQPNVQEKAVPLPEEIRNKRILVVDDNQTNLDILIGYLKGWGCSFDTARNGEAAISLMHAESTVGAPFDLAIIDMYMPEMDGAELGRRIKSDPRLKNTLLIMLTSLGMRGDATRMRTIGFSAYLTKPIGRAQLFDSLAAVLGHNKKRIVGEKRPLVTRHSLADDKYKQKRILLVEDNAVNRKLGLRLLENFGFQADAVANGREALQTLESASYDAVLMDVQMPEMDGLEATRRIRDPRSKVRNHLVPIIAMTAHAMKGDREICLEAGMNDYVSKPIQPQELFSAVERQLETIQ